MRKTETFEINAKVKRQACLALACVYLNGSVGASEGASKHSAEQPEVTELAGPTMCRTREHIL
jgi:hypothetical protein